MGGSRQTPASGPIPRTSETSARVTVRIVHPNAVVGWVYIWVRGRVGTYGCGCGWVWVGVGVGVGVSMGGSGCGWVRGVYMVWWRCVGWGSSKQASKPSVPARAACRPSTPPCTRRRCCSSIRPAVDRTRTPTLQPPSAATHRPGHAGTPLHWKGGGMMVSAGQHAWGAQGGLVIGARVGVWVCGYVRVYMCVCVEVRVRGSAWKCAWCCCGVTA